VLVRGDLSDPAHCSSIVDTAMKEFGHLEILINNAAYQMTHETIEEVTDEEWDYTFAVNVGAMFRLCRAAVPHLTAGASIINTTSINSDQPSPSLLPYATTKGAIANFTAGLAQQLGSRGIRVNSVAPGPIWTPLIPSTMPPDRVREFGQHTPLGANRASRPNWLPSTCCSLPTRAATFRPPASRSPADGPSSDLSAFPGGLVHRR
jgi:NAD(P)-dependent dehydrogenase (short-subunit alcohol dehydrogenase family)